MNRLQYRIVFNKLRGQLMAVAETAVSQTKGGSSGESAGPAQRTLVCGQMPEPVSRGPPSLLALAAAFAMGALVTLVPDATAQVKADPNAPRNQQPTVVNSANGTVQVNIQTPSAAGISRNTYSQFDVDKRGVILNNSRADASTQLGGFVQANPWLAKGSARVILNEVNSSAPSQLKGYVEVAGQRAEVIIANPSGIQIDGGGFINTSAAVLTTGTPRFNADGSIAGYGVQGGLIRVDGQGLDGSQTDYTALLARAVEINAGIWAKDARIQTGTQLMTAEGAGEGRGAGEALASAGERPRYALDSTVLGGIYAQRITLVGTEAGLGVRQAGVIVGGQLTLRADGWLENTGTVYAQEGDAAGATGANGVGVITGVTAAPALAVQSASGVRNAGWMAARGSTAIAAPVIEGAAGSVTAAGLASDGTIVAGTTGANGTTGAPSLSLHAGQSNRQAGQLLASGALSARAPSVDLDGAQAQAGSITIDGTTVAARQSLLVTQGAVTVSGGGSLDLTRAQVQGQSVAASAAVVTVDEATLLAAGMLRVKADERLGSREATLVGGALALSARDIDATRAQWLHLGSEALSVRGDGTLVVDDARIAGNASTLTLAARAISAQRATIEHYGAGALSLQSGLLDLQAARVVSTGDFRIAATQATLDHADIGAQTLDWHVATLSHRDASTRAAGTAASTLTVDGTFDNRQGRIESNSEALAVKAGAIDNGVGVLSTSGAALRLDASSIGNRGGLLLSQGRLDIGGAGGLDVVDNSGGHVQGADLVLKAVQWGNAGGRVSAIGEAGTSGSAKLNVGDWRNGDGSVDARTLSLTAERLSGAGVVHARGDGAITASSLTTTGTLTAGGALTVRADSVDSSGVMAAGLRTDGSVGSAGDLVVEAAGTLRHAGTLLAGGSLRASADVLALQDGVLQGGAVSLTARSGALGLERATLNAHGALSLEAAARLVTDSAKLAGSQIDVRAADWRNAGGELVQTGASGTMALRVDGVLDNRGGRIGASGASLTLGAATLDNTQGRIAQAGEALGIEVGRLAGARGELLAQGALSLTVRGAADLSGATTQARSIDLHAGALTHRSGEMAAATDVAIAARLIDNDGGKLRADGALSLSAADIVNRDGQMSGASVTLAADHLVNGGQGLIASVGGMTLRAGALDNGGQLQAQGLATIVVDGALTNAGTVRGMDAVVLSAGRLAQSATGTIAAQRDLTVNASVIDSDGAFAAGLRADGTLGASGDLALRSDDALRQSGHLLAAGALSATGASVDLSGAKAQSASLAFEATGAARGDLRLTGTEAATGGRLSLLAAGLIDSTGATLSGADVSLTARQWNHAGGLLAQTGSTGRLVATVAGRMDNVVADDGVGGRKQGVISAQGREVSLQAGELGNAGGRIVQAGGGDLTLRAGRIDGASGQFLTEGRLTIDATGVVDLSQATTQSTGLALTAASLDHRGGHLLTQGDATLTVVGTLRNEGGTISAGGALGIDADSIENQAGQLDGQRLTLGAATLNNGARGLVASRGDLTVHAGDWINDGTAQAAGRAELMVTGGLTNAGSIHAQGLGVVSAGAFSQSATGVLAGQAGLTVSAGSVNGAGTLAAGLKGDGTFAASGDLRLDVTGTLQHGGQLLAVGALSASAAELRLEDSRAWANSATLTTTVGTGAASYDIALDRATWAIADRFGLKAAGAVGSDGAHIEAGSVVLDAASWRNLAGHWLQTAGTGSLTVSVAGLLDNRQGEIGAKGAAMTLSADRLDNGSGRLVQAVGDLRIQVRQFDGAQGQTLSTGALALNATGTITLDGATTQAAQLRLDAAALSHDGGKLLSAGDAVLRVGGVLSNRSGQMQAGGALDLGAASLDNTGGQLSGQTVTARADQLDNGARGLIASTGALTVDAAQLSNAGTMQSGGDVALTVTGRLDNGGMVYSQGRGTVRADVLTNIGTIAAQGALGASATQLSGSGAFAAGLRPDNTLAASGDLSLSATQSLQLGGLATAAGDLSIDAPSLQLQGAQLQSRAMTLRASAGDLSLDRGTVAASGLLTLSAGGDVSTTLAQLGAGAVDLRARDWNNAGGRVSQTLAAGALQTTLTGNLNNHGGTIESAGASTTLSATTVDNGGGRIAQAGGALTLRASQWDGAQGQVLASGALDWHVTGALTLTGATTQADSVRLAAGSLAHDGGQLAATRGVGIDVDGAMGNHGGSIAAGGALDLESSSLSNASGGLLQAGGALTVRLTGAQALDNQGGRLRAGADLSLNAAGLDNRGGWIGGDGLLTVRTPGAVLNQQGTLLAQGSVSVQSASLANLGGRIASVQGDVGLTTSGLLDNAQGSVLAGRGLTLNSTGLVNRGGELSGATVSVDARGQALDNAGGRMLASDAMTVRSGTLNNAGGLLQSMGTLTIDTSGAALTNARDAAVTTVTGIRAQGELRIDAGSVDNGAGISGGAVTLNTGTLTNRDLVSGRTVTLGVGGTLDNRSGQLIGTQRVSATAAQVLNQGGLVHGAQSVDVRSAGLIDNRDTGGANLGIQGGAVTLVAGQVDNRNGQMRTDGDLRVTASQFVDNGGGLLSASGQSVIGDGSADGRASALNLRNGGGRIWGGSGVGLSASGLGGGEVSSGGALSLTLSGDLSYGAGTLIQSRGDTTIQLGGNFSNDGVLRSGGLLSISAASIDNRASGELSGARTQLTAAGTLTNRGLIDGEAVTVSADQLLNLGSGRLYGDAITLSGGRLINDVEGAQAAVIAARQSLDATFTREVLNREQSLIYADGQLRMSADSLLNENATIEGSRGVTLSLRNGLSNRSVYAGAENANPTADQPQILASKAFISSGGDMSITAGSVVNSGATIESRGNLLLASGDIQNLNPYLKWTTGGTSYLATITLSGGIINEQRDVTDEYAVRETLSEFFQAVGNNFGVADVYSVQREGAALTQTAAGRIIVGGQLTVLGGRIRNDMSQVIGRDGVDIQADSIQNVSAAVQVTETTTFISYNGINSPMGQPRVTTSTTTITPTVGGLGGGSPTVAPTPGRTAAGAVSGGPGAQAQSVGGVAAVGASGTGAVGALSGLQRQSVGLGQAVSAVAAQTAWRAGGSQQTALVALDEEIGASGPMQGAVRDPGRAQAQSVRGAEVGTLDASTSVAGRSAQAVDLKSAEGTFSSGAAAKGPGGLGLDAGKTAQVVGGQIGRLQASLPKPSLTVPSNSLFKSHPEPGARYLVETDPRFANYRDWLSSDFLLQQMALDPTTTQKRLGDGFYEQRLVREQIGQLTGTTFLQGYASDEEMYRALLTNGATFAKDHQLRPGVALTQAQIEALTTDLVWLVEQEVTLADGSAQRVLVPQVYLLPREGDLTNAGALIAGSRVQMALSGDLDNRGSLSAGGDLSVTAANIANSGSVRGASLALTARQDLSNLGGELSAQNDLMLTAGRDLQIGSTTSTTDSALLNFKGSNTVLDQVARLNAGGVMVLQAGRDATLTAAQLTQTGEAGGVLVQAGRDLKLETVKTGQQDAWELGGMAKATRNEQLDVGTLVRADGAVVLKAGQDATLKAATVLGDGGIRVDAARDLMLAAGQSTSDSSRVRDANNYRSDAAKSDIGTSLKSGDALALTAGGDLKATAARVNSAGALQLHADGDVKLLAGQSTYEMEQATKTKTSGFLSSTTKTTYESLDRTTAQATTVSGQTVEVTAGKDLLVKGGNVVSDDGTVLGAKGDVRIESVVDRLVQDQRSQTVKSGLIGAGIGFTVGKSSLSRDTATTQETNASSTVASVAGDVTIVAGNAYRQIGSDVRAPGGDVTVAAKSIDIEEARLASTSDTTTKFKQSGLTVSVSAPGVDAALGAVKAGEHVTQTDDDRMKALGAATAISKARQAQEEIEKFNKMSDAEKEQSIRFNISLGSQQSKSTQHNESDQAAGSSVLADGKLSLIATGGGQDSNVTVQGSSLAGQDVLIKADNAISLLAARNTSEQHSKDSSSSASVGVGISLGKDSRLGFTASGSVSKGNADGKDTSYTTTQVTGGSSVTLASGADTALQGAVVTAPKVTADVGGNLKIESLQDTAKFDSKSTSAGGSATFGYGAGASANFSQSKVNADYAAVGEQAGIRAGDGGFQVNVKGNTDLKGGAITSSQAAIDAGKNSFSTGTLTSSDIDNRSQFSASAVTVSAGTGGGMAGAYKDSGDERSTTRSTISAGATTITSADVASQAALDKLDRGATSDATAGKLAQGWDGQQLAQQAKLNAQIVAEFGAQAAKEIGDFAASKTKAHDEANLYLALKGAELTLTAEQKTLLGSMEREGQFTVDKANATLNDPKVMADYEAWKEGGASRAALHAVVGGLAGDLAGAIGGAGSSLAAPGLNVLQGSIKDKLVAAGMQAEGKEGAPSLADGLARLVTGLVAGAGGAALSVDGGAAALNQDFNNRQLHSKEIWLIERLAKNKATEVCKQGPGCDVTKVERMLVDAMQRVAEATVDATHEENSLAYLNSISDIAARDPASAAAFGGAASYLELLQQAKSLLAPYVGQPILDANGKPVILNGSPEKYFEATEAQRQNQYGNTLLGQLPNVSISPGMQVRDQERLASLGVKLGSVEPDYIIEETLLGGRAAKMLADVAGGLTSAAIKLDLKLANIVNPARQGNVSALKITTDAIPMKLSEAEAGLLERIGATRDVATQARMREELADAYFQRAGYTKLQGKCGADNCFDGVYTDGKNILINESKPLGANGTISLSPANGTLPTQMTDNWVTDAVGRLMKSGDPAAMRTARLIEAAQTNGTLIKVVTASREQTALIVKVK